MTTSANLIQHRIATDPAARVEVHEGEFFDGEQGFQLIFRYDYLNGYRSISVKDRAVLRSLADQIENLLNVDNSDNA